MIVRSLLVVDGLVVNGVSDLVGNGDVTGGVTPYFQGTNVTVPSGNTVNNTGAETAFASTFTIPANSLAVGDLIVLELAGIYGTTGTPTLQLKVKFASTVLLNTGALTMGAGLSGQPWTGRALLTVDSIGSSGWLECSGTFVLATAGTTALIELVNGGQVTVDTTADSALSVTAQWNPGASANTITLRQYAIERKRAA